MIFTKSVTITTRQQNTYPNLRKVKIQQWQKPEAHKTRINKMQREKGEKFPTMEIPDWSVWYINRTMLNETAIKVLRRAKLNCALICCSSPWLACSLYKNNSVALANHFCRSGYVIHIGPHHAKFLVAFRNGYEHFVWRIPRTQLPQELSCKFGGKKYKYVNRFRATGSLLDGKSTCGVHVRTAFT
jgi:hypothetical protein